MTTPETAYGRYARLAGLTPSTAHLDDMSIDGYLWQNLYEYADTTPTPPEDIAEITHLWATSPEGFASTNLAALGRLHGDGGWFTVVAWCDTSGFDCMGQVDWHRADTREQAIRFGLDREARAHLGLSLPGAGGGA